MGTKILCEIGFVEIPITIELAATCPTGQEPINSTNCSPCQVNTISNTVSTDLCSPCTEGKFSLEGASECTASSCPAGQEPSSPTECSKCQADTFSSTDSTKLCAPCAEGKFSIQEASECTAATCPAGQEPSSTTECSRCPANKFSNTMSTEPCAYCPIGKYSDYGSDECVLEVPPSIIVSGVCVPSGNYNGLYWPVQETESRRWYFKNDNDLFLYWDASCEGSGENYNAHRWILNDNLAMTSEGDDCRFDGYIESISMAPPVGNYTWKISCDFSIVDTELKIEAIVPIDRAINTVEKLFGAISKFGTLNRMRSGDRALVEAGTYRCVTGTESCHNFIKMYYTDQLFGSIACAGESLGCVIDGEDKRDIMWIDGTGSDKLTLRGIRFCRGNSMVTKPISYGGGLGLGKEAIVKLEFCSFDSCSAHQGGAIFLNGGTDLSSYGVSFTNNSATGQGRDIRNDGTLAILDTCPDEWTGLTTKGEPLDVSGRAALALGTPNSYTIGSCTVCPLGKANPRAWYDLSASLTCQTCTLGKYRSQSVASCTICSAGKYNNDEGTNGLLHADCTSCVAGKHLPDDGSTASSHDSDADCITCAAGKYSLAAAPTCVDCAKGKYLTNDHEQHSSDHDEEDDCIQCPTGKYNDITGSTSCKNCLEGKYLDFTGAIAETQCLSCAEGKHNNGVGLTTDCFFCASGKIAPSEGYHECTDCITGTYASSAGMTECIQCAEDTYSNEVGSQTCQQCDGTWADFKGAVECQKCPQYMTFNGTSCICQESFIREKDSRRCTCKAGETVVDGKCVACDDGRYKDQPGTKACSVCDADAIEGAFESIPGANKTSSASCACGFGKFAEAPDGDNPGKLNGICKVCADIELPEGVNCSKVGLTKATLPIVDGYWRSSKNDHDIVKCENLESCTHSSDEDLCAEGHTGPICSVCKDGFNKDTLGVCKSCGSAGVSVGFYALCGVLGITILYLVLRKKIGKEKLTLAAVTEGITRVTSDDKHWSQRLNTKAKILTSFYQIVSKFPSTMDIQYPDVYRIFATAVNNFFNLNSIGLISVGCFLPRSMYSFYGSFLVTAITPIIFCLILLVATLLQCRKLNPDAARKLTASRFGIFSGFLYLIFSSTTTMSFTAFFCTTYGADDTEYLIADRSIDCNSDFHKKFKLLSYVMILVYPIGITTIYTVELWKHRAAIQNSKTREEDPTIQHLVFLWRDYRAQYWWFEIYESFRRLSFAGLLVIFKPGGAPQLCFSLILAFISSLMYSTYQPFDRTEENTLAKTSSISIFLTLLAAILISLKDKFVEDYNDGFGVLLVTTKSVADGLNIEMGRKIKNANSKGGEGRENDDIIVL
ncbi:hypothetical protein TrLO_g2943 [Triparma laevis f. longispina]|uniref:Tyrosine-protein kinase ephrin type A/B receptor-like domain-containing protein n=1 Tax=Triparma laevis f. longispina TaxID=1714387 RepID=A0A9W7FHV9_9STRA|nr:hypothetical protein TrLO_g2943 [Triparma laevis f. longispina]